MDGNGRWAESKGKSRFFGHRAGHSAALKTVAHCAKVGVSSLTLYAFSSENWNRPKKEVNALMMLFSQAIKRNRKLLKKHKIKFNVIGDITKFSSKLQKEIIDLEAETKDYTKMTLNIAANYGGKWDIVNACKQIVAKGITKDDITEELFAKYLSMAEQKEVDLLIRTGGEQRVSNYLLWQIAYSEFYFIDRFWPDIKENDIDEAIQVFSKRVRRFGALTEETITES